MSELTDIRVAVLATDGFEESELTEPVKALRDAGARVTILSLVAFRCARHPEQLAPIQDVLGWHIAP